MIDKNIYDFDSVTNRLSSDSHKWNNYDNSILPMGLSDMDFIVATPIIEALQKRISHGIFGYPCHPPDDFVELFIDKMQVDYNWKIEPNELILLPSTHEAFKLVFRMTGEIGSEIIMNTPLYAPLLWAPNTVGKKLITNELYKDSSGNYSIDIEAMESEITANTKLLLLCNPHNPIGRVYKKPELEQLADLALRHNLLICSDDVHYGLVYRGFRYMPIASLSDEIADRTITLISPSKTFNTPGFKFSIAVVKNKRLYKTLRGQLDNYPADILGMVAASAAYKDGENWKLQLLDYLGENRDYISTYIQENHLDIKVTPIEGTYLAWLDFSQYNFGKSPYRFFLEEGKLALGDGEEFGDGGDGFLRLNFGCPKQTLTDGLKRISKALTKLQ